MMCTPGRPFCLALLAASALVAADYKIQLKQQEFALPAGTTIEQIVTGRAPLKDLTAGDVLLLHEITMAEEQVVENKVKIGRTEVEVRYRAGKELKKALPLGIDASFNKGRAPGEESFCWSCTIQVNVPIGQDTVLGCLEMPTGGVRLSIIRIERIPKQREGEPALAADGPQKGTLPVKQ